MKPPRIRMPALFFLFCGLMLLWGLNAGNPALAGYPARHGAGFAPQIYKSGYTYGNGIYFAPYDFTVHTEPSETAPVAGRFHWSRKTAGSLVEAVSDDGTEKRMPPSNQVFFCFYPELDVAMMAVTGDNDQGWVEVVYDQVRRKTGWVRLKTPPPGEAETSTAKNAASGGARGLPPMDMGDPAHFGVYQTWLEFMKLNAKPNGIYWLSGVSQYQRSVRASDADDAKLIPVTIIRDLKVKHARGNWLLVEVLDFERNMPIGWVRWRDEDGNLLVFPNIAGMRAPIVTTAY